MRALCFGGLLLAAAVATADEKKADPREKPETAVAEGIRLLEKKEVKKFLETFVSPDDMKTILSEDRDLDKFVERFSKGKAAVLLKVLKAVKDVKPDLDKDGKVATFKLKEKIEDAPSDKLTLKKVDQYWYVAN